MANKFRASQLKTSVKAGAVRMQNELRHAANCKICAHPERVAIERDFIDWHSPAWITREYSLKNRSSVYRHAHAMGLVQKRGRNLRAALAHIIEQVSDVRANASAVVAAVQTYGKLNARGEWIEAEEQIALDEVFDQMTDVELESYAREGKLPERFSQEVATVSNGAAE